MIARGIATTCELTGGLGKFYDILEKIKQEEYKSKKVSTSGSYKGRTGDALALRGEEGRDKLRKAVGKCK